MNDLMYILKDVNHTERDKFYNIINNHYLYDDHQLKDYFSNIDNYILQKMQFFMKTLSNGCNNNTQMLAVVDLLSQANKQSSKTKKKRCPNGTNRRKKNCVKTKKKKK